MSQFPSPYNPPPPYPHGYGYSAPQVDDLAPSRRAAILMWIIGGLLVLVGLCCGAVATVPYEQLPAESRQQFSHIPEVSRYFQTTFAILAGLSAIPGLLLIVLAFFVRGGGLGATITSIVVTSIIVLLLLGMVLIGAASIGNQPGRAEAISGIAVFAVPLVLFAILLFMLIGAVRASSTARARAMQYQSQYWQYQQNQPTHETMPPAPSSGPGRPPQTPGDSPPPEP